MRRCTQFCIYAACFFVVHAQAQIGAPSPQQTPRANQLPLSGRGNGNGSVTATQSAVPGTTTSVNTINTTVQTSGPYAGSASGAAMPFSGKLSFRQAIERGLQYNLGAIGLNDTVRQALAHFTWCAVPYCRISPAALLKPWSRRICVHWACGFHRPFRVLAFLPSSAHSIILTCEPD